MNAPIAPGEQSAASKQADPAAYHRVGSRVLAELSHTAEVAAWAVESPSLAEQVIDANRTTPFTYVPQREAKLDGYARQEEQTTVMTEHEGLLQLRDFLTEYAVIGRVSDDQETRDLAKKAEGMLETMTYIGKEELDEATAAIAKEWKQYLADGGSLYMWAQPRKSSAFMLDKVLEHFTDEELQAQKGNLHFVDALQYRYGQEPSPLPDTHRIVMLEDWIATGRQLHNAHASDVIRGWQYERPANVEVQLITATEAQMSEGFAVVDEMAADGSTYKRIPVRGYYRTRQDQDGNSCVTGLHSSTDDDFEIPIAKMVENLHANRNHPDAKMPPLTNIVRDYRNFDWQPQHIRRAEALLGEELSGLNL